VAASIIVPAAFITYGGPNATSGPNHMELPTVSKRNHRRQPNGSSGGNQMELRWQPIGGTRCGRVRCVFLDAGQSATPNAATTERGPPDHLKTCAHKAHKLRRKGLQFPRCSSHTQHLRLQCTGRSAKPRRFIAAGDSEAVAMQLSTTWLPARSEKVSSAQPLAMKGCTVQFGAGDAS